MRAGRRDKRIRIEVRATATSGTGQRTESWSLYKEVFAQASYISGDEVYRASQEILSAATLVFRIEYLSGINARDHRIIYEGNTYDVRYVAEVGRREALDITALLRK